MSDPIIYHEYERCTCPTRMREVETTYEALLESFGEDLSSGNLVTPLVHRCQQLERTITTLRADLERVAAERDEFRLAWDAAGKVARDQVGESARVRHQRNDARAEVETARAEWVLATTRLGQAMCLLADAEQVLVNIVCIGGDDRASQVVDAIRAWLGRTSTLPAEFA